MRDEIGTPNRKITLTSEITKRETNIYGNLTDWWRKYKMLQIGQATLMEGTIQKTLAKEENQKIHYTVQQYRQN